MSNDKMREEFEVWAESALGLSIRRNPAGGYQSFGVYSAWEAWQASREALVVELPYVHSYPANEAASDVDYYIDEGRHDMRRLCRKAIEAAGVKVKL